MPMFTTLPLLLTAALHAAPSPNPPAPSLPDSLPQLDSALVVQARTEVEATLRTQRQKDSLLLAPHLPDVVRAKLEECARSFTAQKSWIDSVRQAEPTRLAELKANVETLRRAWESQRDSQIARIADPAVRGRIQERIVQIDRQQATILEQLKQRRELLQRRAAELEARRKPGGNAPSP